MTTVSKAKSRLTPPGRRRRGSCTSRRRFRRAPRSRRPAPRRCRRCGGSSCRRVGPLRGRPRPRGSVDRCSSWRGTVAAPPSTTIETINTVEREIGDVDRRVDLPGLRDQRADVDRLRVRGVDLEQQVLDDDREAEGHEQRREGVAVDALLEQRALHDVAQQREDRHDDEERPDFGQVELRDQEDRGVARDDRHVAVGQVDDLHHAEHQRQSAGEQRVEAAQEDARDDDVEPDHVDSPVGAACDGPEVGRFDLGRTQLARRAHERRLAFEQTVHARRDRERLARRLVRRAARRCPAATIFGKNS